MNGDKRMKENTGIYVPLVTPYNVDGSVDYEGLAKATRFTLSKGVDGIYACGGTAEFSLLSTDERKRCLEVIIENADGAEVIAHVGAASTAEAVELAKHAAKVGAKMLSAVAPYYFGYSFSQIKEYFHTIAHATDLELMIYNAAQGRTYTLGEMLELMSDEKISAMKYTNFNFFHLERLIAAFPEKRFFTGPDEMFLAGQAVGAHGAIGTTYNAVGEYYAEMRRLYKQGNVEAALKITNKTNELIEALLGDNLIAGTKYLMTLQGLDILPISRAPFGEPSEETKKKLKETYTRLFVENK